MEDVKIKSLARFIQTKNVGFIHLIMFTSIKKSNRAFRLP